jgi:hypothetical protein
MQELKTTLQGLMDKFNAKMANDKGFQEHWAGKERSIVLEFSDQGAIHLYLRDCQLTALGDGALPASDIRILTDSATFNAIINKKMSGMRAYVTQKLKIKASAEDMLAIRKLVS